MANIAKINYLVDLLAGISFLITSITGLILLFFLPSGVQQGSYEEFLGIQKIFFVSAHNLAGVALILLVSIHLILHWKWILYMTKSFLKK